MTEQSYSKKIYLKIYDIFNPYNIGRNNDIIIRYHKKDKTCMRPLTATMHKMHRADTDNYITGVAPQGRTNVRRLTPIECERLQGVNDNYTDCVSDTQRYRMLGNGWTVDVIAHIFSFLKGGGNF
jgi:site-specific DNA-cytosine methylase